MKVVQMLRTAMFVAAIAGACVTDARRSGKAKLCEADHPAPAPKTNVTTVIAPKPVAKPAAMADSKAEVGADAGAKGPGQNTPQAPAPAPGAAPGPAPGAANPGPAPGAANPGAAPGPAPGAAPAPAPAGGAATNAGKVKSSFAYKGHDAGGAGTYDMLMDLATCSKQPHKVSNPVSPLDDDLTFVFRGPMTIHNIAIFDGSSGSWNKVSSYTKGGAATNMVFMNNRNIDYTGKSSPQGFAGADGRGTSKTPVAFSGELGGATGKGVYGDEATGAEVNILQDKKCGQGVECKGYYDKDGTAMLGWGGAKKIFITKVQMPNGPAPNLPAIWALNGQVVRAGQYDKCNCRGMGKAGGCGELDIAEVIEKDTNVVATHYYKFSDGTGHDSWSKRPTNAPTVYITIIHESYGVKVLEIDEFDFNAGTVSGDVVSQWLGA